MKTKKQENNNLYIYGKHASISFIKESPKKIIRIFIQQNINDSNKNGLMETINQEIPNVKIDFVEKKFLDDMSDDQNHQGIVLEIEPFNYSSIEEILSVAKQRNELPFILILDEIEDPFNFGSILRTADAAGVHGVIIPDRRSVKVNNTVFKTSTGAVNRIKISKVVNLNKAIEELKKNEVWVASSDISGEDYAQFDGKLPIALVIGNESKGISKLTKEISDFHLTIPMSGQIQSLNASVAGSLLMYQIFNSRRL